MSKSKFKAVEKATSDAQVETAPVETPVEQTTPHHRRHR
jgi:hypothetical protein